MIYFCIDLWYFNQINTKYLNIRTYQQICSNLIIEVFNRYFIIVPPKTLNISTCRSHFHVLSRRYTGIIFWVFTWLECVIMYKNEILWRLWMNCRSYNGLNTSEYLIIKKNTNKTFTTCGWVTNYALFIRTFW